MKAAIVIDPDGRIFDLRRKQEKPTLEELQAAVGGYIEIVRLPSEKVLMVVNEEGKVHGLAPNVLATLLYSAREVIAGPAILIDAELLD